MPLPVDPSAVDTHAALTAVVRQRIADIRPVIVSVDGYDGRGKTHAARHLARELDAQHLDGDDYIQDGNQPYPDILDLARLKSDIGRILNAGGVIVFSSVLALTVLDAIRAKPTSRIYVRHSWPEGHRSDAEVLEPHKSAEQLLAEEDELCVAAGISAGAPVLRRELLRYHLERQPHRVADVIYDVCFKPSAA